MQQRHISGKVLWQQKIRPRLLAGDMEDGLNFVRDWLEEAPNNAMSWEIFQHLYGAGAHANVPVRIGNDEYSITLRNQVGLAAGFTKDARGSLALNETGLGFMGIGTNPLLPQSGNERPRFFADYHKEDNFLTLVNRFGFDCKEGVEGPVQRVQKIWRERGEDAIKTTIIWSFGPNKTTMERYEETHDLRLIADDIVYATVCAMPVIRRGDGIAFNVTSPNTRGLRTLLYRLPELLELVIGGIHLATTLFKKPTPPCMIKLSPDMPPEQMRHVARSTRLYPEIIAFEAFNTTIDERIGARYGVTQIGGVSGDPLTDLAYEKLVILNHIVEEEGLDINLIGVGGIMQPQHAVDRLAIGEKVKAVEIFSGIFKNGISFISEIQEALATT